MPALDRRITLRFTASYFDAFGESQSAVFDRTVWATRVDRSQSDKNDAGGDLLQATRLYRVRYTQEIARLPAVPAPLMTAIPEAQREMARATINVLDDNDTFNLDNQREAVQRGERRRYIDLECVGEITA